MGQKASKALRPPRVITKHPEKCQQEQLQDDQEDASSSTLLHVVDRSTHVQVYLLCKRRPGCTGMFWRPDPTGQIAFPVSQTNKNWPRDDAKLRGIAITLSDNTQWLLVEELQQRGQTEWLPAPAGAAMPFEYNNHYYLKALQEQ